MGQTLNECDACNTFLASNYEDHLGNLTLYWRSLARISGKRGKPTFKKKDTLRIEADETSLHIHLSDPGAKAQMEKQEGWFSYTLPADTTSPPFIPIRAAMSLVKFACSICPFELLGECKPAIAWLMGRLKGGFSYFPVFYAFTPGPGLHLTDRLVLLQRKVDEPIPNFWIVVSFANYQLQTFVPGCPADSDWFRKGQPATLKPLHYPVQLPDDWPLEPSEYKVFDWSGTKPITVSPRATLNLIKAKVVKPDESDEVE